MRHRILLALVALAALLVPAATASAGRSQPTYLEAPNELLNGSPHAALDEIDALGADGIRILLRWREVAPAPEATTKPAFNALDPDAYSGWGKYDAVIDGARERGLKVHVTITGAVPTWATARKDPEGLNTPSATEFGRFVTAVGRRYASRVQLWSIWNEPNLGKLLKPLYVGRTNRLASAMIYRDLYLRGYAALRGAGARAPILVGELAPQRNSQRENGTIAPMRFLRTMLCLDARSRPVKVRGARCAKLPTQGLALHPYSTMLGPFLRPTVDPDNVTIGVLERATTTLDRAARAGAIARNVPLYLTEFGVQSWPDRTSGVPFDVQSDYRSMSERIAWLNPRVKSFSQYLLHDDSNTEDFNRHSAFESGLYAFEGRAPKPSLHGFRLPLVVVPARASTTKARLWGLVRPATRAGTVVIEYRDRGAWRRLGVQRFSSTGYWERSVTTRAKRQWRVVWTDAEGEEHVGSATKAWARPWQG